MNAFGKLGLMMLVLVAAAAILAGVLGKHGALEQPYRDRMLAPPSAHHPFGIDGTGRDMFTRVLYGARSTLAIAGSAVALSLFIGLILGPLAAMRGGWTDLVISRTIDLLIGFPPLLLGLFFLTFLSPSARSVSLAVAIAGAPAMVRQFRAAFLAEEAKQYVLAAMALGSSRWRIALREIFPNCTGIIAVTVTLQLGSAILETAGLSFLGLSGEPDSPEWGNMLRQQYADFRAAPYLMFAPGAAIAWTVLSCNLLADGLRRR